MSAHPLRRNREFVLLQSGQLLSNVGTQATTIAYPLLVLALTHSATRAGLVTFARALPLALLALPAGEIADRRDRRSVMILADAVRVAAVGSLATMVLAHAVEFWTIPVIAFVEGCGAALFGAAAPGALRAIVPREQLPVAVSMRTGRNALVRLVGPPVGGVLYQLARAVPFLVDVVSYACSTISMLLLRTPFQEPRQPDPSSLRARLAEGIQFVWNQPFLRSIALLFALANFIGPGLLFALVVLARAQGLNGFAIGALVAVFGVSLLAGSVLSGYVRRVLPVRGVMVLELWTWCGCALFVIWPSVYVLTACLVPTGLAIPATDSVVHAYRIAITPDHVLGRAESVRSAISLAIASLGPLVAGLLLESTSPRIAIGLFAAAGLTLALWGTLDPSIRNAPSLEVMSSG
ncbi:MAG TPA: MFS transporter [Acidimicrobiales bacterium]|nr:MFS transporter [Acidimicrobiales bacterium]